MAKEYSRSDRVASQIQRELAELLRTHVEEPALGMITLSAVEVTRDLAVAKAFVSFLAAKEPTKQCLARLVQLTPMLRHELGRRMRLRVMPELRFVFDESLERGLRMHDLLNQLKTEHPNSLDDSAGEA